jgi:hypothetical protein
MKSFHHSTVCHVRWINTYCQIGPITCIDSDPCRHTNSQEKKVKNSTGYQFPVYQQTYDKIRTFCHRRPHITVYKQYIVSLVRKCRLLITREKSDTELDIRKGWKWVSRVWIFPLFHVSQQPAADLWRNNMLPCNGPPTTTPDKLLRIMSCCWLLWNVEEWKNPYTRHSFPRSLFVICHFSFGHCVICPSIYGFWLPL